MTTKELLLKQMAACHDEENWFVPITKALAGLTAEQAAWRDGSMNNSIWQNVNHLSFWNERFINRFLDIPMEKFEGDNDTTFRTGKENGSEEDWISAKERLLGILSRWKTVVTEADDEKFLRSKPPSGIWYEVIGNISMHTAYHIGQIVHTRKLQGSWTPTEWVITAPPVPASVS
jgi:hypothetical protein